MPSPSRSSSPSNKLPTLQTQSQCSQCKRLPSINIRASRVGVTNFTNVIKSLHPGESIDYFPIIEEILCFGWDGRILGHIIKRALDELKEYDDDIKRSNKQKNLPIEFY
ncbi:hypothetical protein Glove_279g9 [Diversispora epigaea]|uniref:Uncharacterized protein n=1 Tax=Diversispora epigaea TaxID=1348612 RepID=A0A397I8N1_9GLOM|nr:hypothetical protein Glove_279g9 [Diversispora epigaea]